MLKGGILHPQLLYHLARSGHTDFVTVCDRGFPVPTDIPRVDLALVDDLPTVLDVLAAIDAQFQIDRILFAEELLLARPERHREMCRRWPHVRMEAVPHLELKELSLKARVTVRTGDTCPYANVILVSG